MTTLYDNPAGVRRYAEISEGIDGRGLVDELARHVAPGAEVLELGSGLGKDLELLAQHFAVTGSEHSPAFLDHLRSAHGDLPILELDARTLQRRDLETARRFEAIYSNKVLHHLEVDELRSSFAAQRRVVRGGGSALHSFWPGRARVERHGLLFQEHDQASLEEALGKGWRVERCYFYSELGHLDSLALLLRAV